MESAKWGLCLTSNSPVKLGVGERIAPNSKNFYCVVCQHHYTSIVHSRHIKSIKHQSNQLHSNGCVL